VSIIPSIGDVPGRSLHGRPSAITATLGSRRSRRDSGTVITSILDRPAGRPAESTPSRRRKRSASELVIGVLFCVPALLGLGVFVFFPLFQAIFLATRGTDINGNPTRSVGFANFAGLFTPEFGGILLHTLIFTAFVVVVGVVIPLSLAVPLSQRLPGMRVFRTLFTLPFAYSASAASVVWLLMLDPSMSPVNWLLKLVGITAPGWTTSSPTSLITVAWVTISPNVFFVIVTTTLTALQALGQVQVMTDGGPNGSSATVVYSIYHNAFENGNNDYGVASAQGIVLLIVGIGLAAIQFGVIERRVHYR
jgi:sn-glycerol 3-phosphate transport system permease protein